MINPFGSGIIAALAMTTVAFAGGGEPGSDGGERGAPPVAQDGGVKVSAKAGKGVTFETDGFKLNLKNRIQVNFAFRNIDSGEDTLGVSIRRARTAFSGSAYKDTVHFYVQMEWADNDTSDILDGLIFWDFWKSDEGSLALQFGQGKTLYGIEATGTSSALEFVDRARATTTFANRRSRQAQVLGKFDEGRLRFNAGLLNNDVAASVINQGDDTNNASNELNWIVGAALGSGHDDMYGTKYTQGSLENSEETEWVVSGALSYGQNDSNDVSGLEYDVINVNGGGALKQGHLHVMGEVFIREEDPDQGNKASSLGWQAQGSWTLDPGTNGTQWALGARLSGVSIDDPSLVFNPGLGTITAGGFTFFNSGDILEIQVVASAYYAAHNLKTQIGYTYQNVDPDNAPSDFTNHVVEVQSQIVF